MLWLLEKVSLDFWHHAWFSYLELPVKATHQLTQVHFQKTYSQLIRSLSRYISEIIYAGEKLKREIRWKKNLKKIDKITKSYYTYTLFLMQTLSIPLVIGSIITKSHIDFIIRCFPELILLYFCKKFHFKGRACWPIAQSSMGKLRDS